MGQLKEGWLHWRNATNWDVLWMVSLRSGPRKHVWRTRQPHSVSCFTWPLKSAYLCEQTNKTVNHLFLHYPADVWHFFFSMFCLKWVMPFSVKDAFEKWISWRVDKSIKRIWNMIPAASFGVFEKKETTDVFMGTQLPICPVSLSSWHYHSPVDNVDSFMDFVSSSFLYRRVPRQHSFDYFHWLLLITIASCSYVLKLLIFSLLQPRICLMPFSCNLLTLPRGVGDATN